MLYYLLAVETSALVYSWLSLAIVQRKSLLCEFPWRDPCSYGAPGVEFTGLHKDTTAVTQIHFLPGQVSSAHLLSECLKRRDATPGRKWRLMLMFNFHCDRAACCHCWMTTRFTCGSWWPVPPERLAGWRGRAWSVYRKWAATASQEDPALRAAGTLEPVDAVLDLKGVRFSSYQAQLFCYSH